MKNIILLLSLLFAVQIGQSQETWNACNSTVKVIPAPSYDSTFVLEAPSRAALQKGMANWVPASSGGGAASYLVYTALINQSGTSAPTATVLENTLGGTVVWGRTASGIYTATLSGAFTENKIYSIPNYLNRYDINGQTLALSRSSDNVMLLETGDNNDMDLQGIQIEIRVYN